MAKPKNRGGRPRGSLGRDRYQIADPASHQRIVAELVDLAGGVREFARKSEVPYQTVSELKNGKLLALSWLNAKRLQYVAVRLWKDRGLDDIARRAVDLADCYAGHPKPPSGDKGKGWFPRADIQSLDHALGNTLAERLKRGRPLPDSPLWAKMPPGWYSLSLKQYLHLLEAGAQLAIHGAPTDHKAIEVFFTGCRSEAAGEEIEAVGLSNRNPQTIGR